MGADRPPLLSDGMDYRKWKLEVEMWELGTAVKEERRGAVCAGQICQIQARDFAMRVDKTKIKAKEGLAYLLTELDKHFKEDDTQCIFLAIEEIEKFIRPTEMKISDYISEFYRRNNRLKELLGAGKEVYHDGILAYRLMSQANLNDHQKQLIKAAMGSTALSFATVEEAMKRCFGDSVIYTDGGHANSGVSTSGLLQVKQDPATFYQNREDFYGSAASQDQGIFYQDKSSYESTSYDYGSNNSGNNMVDRNTGEIMRCEECNSIKHLIDRCPHRDVHSVMFQSENEQFNMNETFKKALIDTGAVSNLCGEIWLDNFLSSLSKEKEKLVEETNSKMTFRFGDGNAIESVSHFILPVELCGKHLPLETFVVPIDLPLLLSKESMKKFGVVLDIARDKIIIDGNEQNLGVTQYGHYVADLFKADTVHRDMEQQLDINQRPEKLALNLHHFFGHPKSENLLRLVEESKFFSNELRNWIISLDSTCQHCRRNKVSSNVSVNKQGSLDLQYFVSPGYGYPNENSVTEKRKHGTKSVKFKEPVSSCGKISQGQASRVEYGYETAVSSSRSNCKDGVKNGTTCVNRGFIGVGSEAAAGYDGVDRMQFPCFSADKVSLDQENYSTHTRTQDWTPVNVKRKYLWNLKRYDLIRYKMKNDKNNVWKMATVLGQTEGASKYRFSLVHQPGNTTSTIRLDRMFVQVFPGVSTAFKSLLSGFG